MGGIWNDIERSESYLVCGMYDKAASLASFILEHILKTDTATSAGNVELIDMMESAGMVLVQSLNELGRTSEIVKELKAVCGSVTNIPIQVLVTGACFQLSDLSHSGLCEFLQEFLGKWRYVEDGHSYILLGAEPNGAYLSGYKGHSVLDIDKYLEVVEVYAVALLGSLLNKTDLAIAWVQKAELPHEKRQDLIRRLSSLHSSKPTSSESEETSPNAHKSEANPRTGSGEKKLGYLPNGVDSRKDALLKLSQKVEPCFWWFRKVNIKFGSARLVISQGNITLFGSFLIFICFVLKKKRATLKQIASKHALTVKKALVDMWQLAFSVQVNPLASIEALPTATHGSRG